MEGQAYVHTRRARRAKRQAPRCPPSPCAAAAKKVVRQNDLLVSGGGRGIRTLVTWITGKTVFETAAFNHSAIPPYSVRCTIRKRRQMRAYKKSPVNLGDGVNKWRRDGDSNPRYAFGAYTISNRAPSASSDISPRAASLQVPSHLRQRGSIHQLI